MALDGELGGPDDTIILKLADKTIAIAESYEVKISILQQPAAFALRLGWNSTAADILTLAAPGTPFELRVMSNGTPRLLQAGFIDSRSVPSSQATQVEIKGRDYLAHLFDSFVEEEQDFPQKNFYDMTRAVMDTIGLREQYGYKLLSTNDANRARMTGVNTSNQNNTELAEQISTGALTGTGQLVYKTPKAKLGTRYYDFLQQQYKLAGLFIWATPDKSFVLARPHSDQKASFYIFRARGGTGQDTNVLDCMFKDDTTMRHQMAIVYGRSGGGKRGVEICRGQFVDDEMFNHGFTKRIVVHDADVKSKEECEYVARRIISDERRAGWQLEYTLSGHQVPSNIGDTGSAIWGPDTVVRVDDEEIHAGQDPSLNFKRNFYVESVTYSRKPQTETKVTLMRQEDLLFATALSPEDNIAIKRAQKGGAKGKTVR